MLSNVRNILKYVGLLVALVCFKPANAQDTLASVLRPRIGLGTGTFTYFGEVQNYQKGFAPLVNKYGGIIYVNAPVTKFFNFEFAANYGKVTANERKLNRNLNFQSRIRMATFYLYYNFYPIFSRNRSRWHPFVGIGFSSFEFLSKTDLYDANGNQYYYWSDGSIKDMDEYDPLAATNAVDLNRDYTYETDLREMDNDGLGKYKEQSFAFPFTLGAEWHLSPRWDFRIATTMNFTMTDLIDNFTFEGTGARHGDPKKDRLLWTYVSLSYDLQFPKNKEFDFGDDPNVPLYAEWDDSDWDSDGIIDALDKCPGTPPEALVDEDGCPLDGDGDGVPDYMDDELNTPDGNYVDEFGVTITEDQLDRHWRLWNDSTGYEHDFAVMTTVVRFGDDDQTEKDGFPVPKGKSYVIIIGKEEKDVTANELHKYLGYNSYDTKIVGDTVYYILGEYVEITEAVKVKEALENDGIEVDGIGKTDNSTGQVTEVDTAVINKVDRINHENNNVIETSPLNDGSYVFRIQVGAYKNRVDMNNVYPGVDVDFATSPDGLTRYYSGKFIAPEGTSTDSAYFEALRYKNKMRSMGHTGSYIVVYKDGKRMTLREAGIEEKNLPSNYDEQAEINTFVEPRDTDTTDNTNSTNTGGIDMTKVKYHVILGQYEGDVPINEFDILSQIGGIVPVRSADGVTTYYSKKFDSKKAMENAMLDYKSYGIDDMKPAYYYDGKYYTEEEFQELLNENGN